MYDGILVPLDGSPFAEQVLPLAVSLARESEMPVDLLRVHRTHPVGYGEDTMLAALDIDPRERAAAAEYLERLAARVAEDGALEVHTLLVDERSVAEAICRQAEQSRDAMIAMTTHGRTGLPRTVRGSVADGVIRHAMVPVLLWRCAGDVPAAAPAAIRHLLVPLDGSAAARTILPHATALASLLDARLTLLRVVAQVAMAPAPAMAMATSPYPDLGYSVAVIDDQATDRALDHARGYLARVAEEVNVEYPGLSLDTRVESGEDPAAAILRVAAETKADLIAMTTHARSGVSRFVLGSTADGVLKGRAGGMLLVRPS